MKAAALLVALVACKGADHGKPAARHDAAPLVVKLPAAFDERAIETATSLVRGRAEPPARFTAPLPANAKEWKAFEAGDARFPPVAYVEDTICRTGEPWVRAALDDALAREPAADRDAAITRWRRLVNRCAGPAICTAMRAAMTGAERPMRAVIAPAFATQCAGTVAPPDDVVGLLRTAGLLGDEVFEVPAEPASDDRVFEVLVAAGRADAIDGEADGRGHDRPLRRIAHLVRPELDGAVFVDRGDLLEAYVGGERYAVASAAEPGWYDLDAAVGLINAILVARDADRRVLTLEGGGQLYLMAAGTHEALETAVRAGLIEAYGGGG